jgi:hypothetical protein
MRLASTPAIPRSISAYTRASSIRIGKPIRIIGGVVVPIKTNATVCRHWIYAQEPPDSGVKVALNTLTRRGFRLLLRSTLDAMRPAVANSP